MFRRDFLNTLAAVPTLAASRPESARITRIRVVQATGHFHKFVAMNAYDQAPKGETYEHPLIRIETNRPGVEGIGAGLYAKLDENFFSAVRALVGADPLSLFTMTDGQVTAPASSLEPLLAKYAFLDAPLLDLAGKLTGKPVWQLLGRSVRDTVPAYDGTLYFADVLHPDKGVAAVTDECKESVDAGYKGLKLKLGRNFKWMAPEAGRARDVEVVHAVRKIVGPKIQVMVDPNNGYRDFDQGWNLVESTAADDLYWVEELFPENVEAYRRLREKMATAGVKTLYADGENFSSAQDFQPYLQPQRLIDVLQLDIRRGGFLGNRALARLGAPAGAQTIPHNWASQTGVLMALHLAKVTPSMPMVEDDRSRLDVLIAEGYRFENGSYTVSNEPGLGIRIDMAKYDRNLKSQERIVA